MKRIEKTGIVISVVVVILAISQLTFGWGFWAHQKINEQAINLLPEPLRGFYEQNKDYIIREAVGPDLRRAINKNEGYYHYMDLDKYGRYPFRNIPGDYNEAVKEFGYETVLKNGIVPWMVKWMTDSLTYAMEKKDVPLILRLSADLGHYVADMHVPFHSTENYDGQLTGNVGIHFRWESGIPEHFGANYNYRGIEGADYFKHPAQQAFEILTGSYELILPSLKADSLAKSGLIGDQLYKVERKEGKKVYIYSNEYYERFNKNLDGMVEAQIRLAIHDVASYWYTAWVNAGKPKFW
ncbi:MAG: zinc dependent phospholipase C family protein [Candidatus Kryptoniota bacterium]